MKKRLIKIIKKQQVDELCEDMELVGPGQILAEARTKLSLSIEDIAQKLKFSKSLVQNLEQDIFDQKLPVTFNRGYLRSYAKLVNADVTEVLNAYDLLDVAEIQRSEMQSFSNLTEKQAEHSRLMWLSYLIVAVLFGLMILWWQQSPKQVIDEKEPKAQQKVTAQDTALVIPDAMQENSSKKSAQQASEQLAGDEVNDDLITLLPDTKSADTQSIIPDVATPKSIIEANPEAIIEDSTAVFTFSGDCWVNIYDATGERVAWGVKKSGYVMTVTGKAPLKVTLGKPELATIVFNGELVDMSLLSVGNIAKFTLPINL